jgi:hypothetical protein
MAAKKVSAAVREVKRGPAPKGRTKQLVEGEFIHARETAWWIGKAHEAAEKSGVDWSAFVRQALRQATQGVLGPLTEPRSSRSFEEPDPFA